MKLLPILVSCLLAGGCASLPSGKPDARDPWERFNRASFKFNDALDRAVLRPTARAYVKVAPRAMRTGVSNFFSNLETVTTLINDALQGKVAAVGHDSARLLLNSTLGLGGLLDPASAAGLDKNDEDFGQTLGKWGVESGPYLMIPLLGPSTVRDLAGRIPDQFTDPSHYLEDDSTRYLITAVEVVDLRAGLLELDEQLSQSFDRYAFVRNAWLQRREFKVKDGDVEDEILEDFDATEPAEAPAPQ
jgi:phospholipid-binding lipoprotein MlaA